MTAEGRLCPFREHAPETPEGLAAALICFRPGVWRRAGEEARVSGLDPAAALACAPAGLDRDLLIILLGEAETGLLLGTAKQP